jgi:transcriptional regulator with XRE-family HTH domain
MSDLKEILAVIKRQLKLRGLTYRDVAEALKLSEASVKRLFTSGRITLDRLLVLCDLLQLSLAELTDEAAHAQPRLSGLSAAQEAELADDAKLLLVAVCVLNHWSPASIVRRYAIDEHECLGLLARLDRIGLIDLLPGNRVRLNVARDFDWRPDGPIRHLFREYGQDDFLAGRFAGDTESFAFVHGMLTPAAAAQVKGHIRRLRQTFDDLHRDGLRVPLDQRSGMGLLIAFREWEPPAFAALRRQEPRNGQTNL